MNKKMSLNMFNEYKEKMMNLISKTEEYIEQHENDDNFDGQKLEQEMTKQYLALQEELLSYDLSDIPFESWQDLQIFSENDYEPDFSKSKANIDFNILDFFGKGNFKNCTIRNLDKFGEMINEESFDEATIKANPELFLSSNFAPDFKEKYYSCKLEMDDLKDLNIKQIEELEKKDLKKHFDRKNSSLSTINAFDTLNLKNMIDLYKLSKDDFDIVTFFLDSSWIFYTGNGMSLQTLIEKVKQAKISEMKQLCYDYARSNIINEKYMDINIQYYPPKFIEENDDIFLVNADIPEEVRNRYYKRELSIDDVIENLNVFSSVPIGNFMEFSFIRDFAERLGEGGLQYVLKNHRDTFDHIRSANHTYEVLRCLQKRDNIEETFSNTIKEYFFDVYGITELQEYYDENGVKKYSVPEWLSSLNFEVVEKFETMDEVKKYNSKTLLINRLQREVLETFDLEKIIQFDNSTHFFSNKAQEDSKNLEGMEALGYYLLKFNYNGDINIPSKDNMTYSNFTDIIAQCLDNMRKHNVFTNYSNYDFIVGEFREKYPNIFIDQNAPEELKTAFYKNSICGNLLYQHKEYIPFLVDKNLNNIINGRFELNCYNSSNGQQNRQALQKVNFIDYYSKLYGNESLLNLIVTYGNIGTDLSSGIFDLAADKEGIEKQYRSIIYKNILNKPEVYYQHLQNVKEFVDEYPDIFLSQEDLNKVPEIIRDNFTNSFYARTLKFEHIRRYPELIKALKNKNLNHVFVRYNKGIYASLNDNCPTELEMIKVIGQDNFLELCSKYGGYLEDIYATLPLVMKDGKYFESNSNDAKEMDYNRLCTIIEEGIAKKCELGEKEYYDLDAPDFLKQKMPNLFLDPNAPQELQERFYCKNNRGLSFSDIVSNKEWLEFLKGKSVTTALLRNTKYSYDDIKQYFEIFGNEKGLKIGLQRTKTVEHMISSHNVELMKQWYDKTGQKFIPDFVVMENFAIEDADKFLASGQNWSSLMKIKDFSGWYESRDAMLKLAYCFGAFDQDQMGMKKLQELLTGVPRHYKSSDMLKLRKLEHDILEYNRILATNPDTIPTMPRGTMEYNYLKEELKKNGVEFTGETVFTDIFNINSDMSATLKLNPQSHPEAMADLRTILAGENIVVTGYEAHQLFGGFSLKYDKDFREFLLKNFDEIRTNPEYIKYVSSVQKQFDSIKAFNSNRTLTWDLAISFVQSNKYMDINVGNDKVAEISAIAGYSQEDFNTLQQIYNYGKTRTFNSIPRIEKSTEKYTYEMLRLDDPLAMAIGTLTDCCQELGNCAEVCMEHSMVDKNGRVFIIKDNQENIVAQSWVWRNKDVLCFDNIEIPDKAFIRASKESPEIGRKGFTDEVYEIYKQAARDLIKADEKIYKELLESGKITQEQYDGLRLGKITVGLGYNDIAESLKNNSTLDNGNISRPLPFEEPIKLSRGLYTNDSNTQYVLEEREDRKEYDGETLPVHTDTVIEYTNDNFDEKMLLMLEKLELVTKHNSGYMDTQLSDNDDRKKIVSSLAKNYDLNPETTKIVMNPNFAIIYDINDNNMKIGDLLYNFTVDNGEQKRDITTDVLLQIKLALNQISTEKVIDVSQLTEEQLEIYNKLGMLNEEINIRKGVGHGK